MVVDNIIDGVKRRVNLGVRDFKYEFDGGEVFYLFAALVAYGYYFGLLTNIMGRAFQQDKDFVFEPSSFDFEMMFGGFYSLHGTLMDSSNVLVTYFGIMVCFFFFIVFGLEFNSKNDYLYNIFLILIELCILLCLNSSSIIVFYFSFEILLILMVSIILLYGKRFRRIKAVYLLVSFTVIGSSSFFLGIVPLWSEYRAATFAVIKVISLDYKVFLCIAFIIIVFLIKVPTPPFHGGLPEVHVEANTVGSVILAAILLKIGIFGLIRSVAWSTFSFGISIAAVICLLGITYVGVVLYRQYDMKRFIAYCSVSHMCYAVIGLFLFSQLAAAGVVFTCFSHAFIASVLFISIGVIYENYGTKIAAYLSGLSNVAPSASTFIVLFFLGNVNFPLTSGFLAEFLVILGVFCENIPIGISLVFLSILLFSASFMRLNQLVFGTSKENNVFFNMTYLVYKVFFSLTAIIFIFGIEVGYLTGLFADLDIPTYVPDYLIAASLFMTREQVNLLKNGAVNNSSNNNNNNKKSGLKKRMDSLRAALKRGITKILGIVAVSAGVCTAGYYGNFEEFKKFLFYFCPCKHTAIKDGYMEKVYPALIKGLTTCLPPGMNTKVVFVFGAVFLFIGFLFIFYLFVRRILKNLFQSSLKLERFEMVLGLLVAVYIFMDIILFLVGRFDVSGAMALFLCPVDFPDAVYKIGTEFMFFREIVRILFALPVCIRSYYGGSKFVYGVGKRGKNRS